MVAFNSNAKKIIYNNINIYTIKLIEYLYKNSAINIINSMNDIITTYGFTDTTNKNNKYVEIKHEGLSIYNKKPFVELKRKYNETKAVELLLALVIYWFNLYIRFNKNVEFNIPVGDFLLL